MDVIIDRTNEVYVRKAPYYWTQAVLNIPPILGGYVINHILTLGMDMGGRMVLIFFYCYSSSNMMIHI
jgi:hypothetical protein